jgi:hypothetical protein
MLGGWWERFADSHRLAEFLPDAEGVIERRHSPVAGLLILVVALVFAGMLAWSALTEVEQVVRAEGQIEPADRVKIINHPDGDASPRSTWSRGSRSPPASRCSASTPSRCRPGWSS